MAEMLFGLKVLITNVLTKAEIIVSVGSFVDFCGGASFMPVLEIIP